MSDRLREKLAEHEEWRPVEGWPYEVSSLGNVRRSDSPGHSTYAGRQLKLYIEKSGYAAVNLCRNGGEIWRIRVHHLVASAFHGTRPDQHEVRHLNGVRADNRVENLTWGTRRENAHDAIAHGTVRKGAKHPKARLTAEKVRQIRRAHRDGERIADIAERYGMTRQAIGDVVTGRNWGHVK